jgi:hypothetical protein
MARFTGAADPVSGGRYVQAPQVQLSGAATAGVVSMFGGATTRPVTGANVAFQAPTTHPYAGFWFANREEDPDNTGVFIYSNPVMVPQREWLVGAVGSVAADPDYGIITLADGRTFDPIELELREDGGFWYTDWTYDAVTGYDFDDAVRFSIPTYVYNANFYDLGYRFQFENATPLNTVETGTGSLPGLSTSNDDLREEWLEVIRRNTAGLAAGIQEIEDRIAFWNRYECYECGYVSIDCECAVADRDFRRVNPFQIHNNFDPEIGLRWTVPFTRAAGTYGAAFDEDAAQAAYDAYQAYLLGAQKLHQLQQLQMLEQIT